MNKKLLFIFLIFFLGIGIIYKDYLFLGKEFLPQDLLTQGLPISKFVERNKNGLLDYPLWYNDIFSGMPLHASGSYHIMFNLEKFFRLFIPENIFYALNGRFTLHLLLGFTFMLIFLYYSLGLSLVSSTIGAFSYIFTSHIIGTEHVNRISCFIYIPLVFMGVYEVFSKNKNRQILGFFLLALGLGFQFNSYHPQITYYTLLLIGFYFLWKIIFDWKDNKTINKLALVLGVSAIILGFLMGLLGFWPLYEYAPYSVRGSGLTGHDKYMWITNWSFSPKSVLDFILPYFEGFSIRTPVNYNGTTQLLPTYWGNMPFTDYPHYLGVVTLFLAFVGLKNIKRNRFIQFLVFMFILTLFLSFGRDFPLVYNIFYNLIPGFDKFRGPAMILIILEFVVAILAAMGSELLIEDEEYREYIYRKFKYISLAFLGLVILIVIFNSAFKDFMYSLYNASGKGHPVLNEIRFNLLMNDIYRFLGILGLIYFVVFIYKNNVINKSIFGFLMMILVFGDLVYIDSKLVHGQYPKGYKELYYQKFYEKQKDIIDYLLKDKEKFRILTLDNLSETRYGYFGIENVAGYHAAKLALYDKIWRSKILLNPGVFNMLNVKYIITQQDLSSLDFLQLIKQDGKIKLYLNKNYLKRVFFVDHYNIIKDDNKALNIISKVSFDPIREFFFDEDIKSPLSNLGKDNIEYKIIEYSPDLIKVKVKTPNNTIMVFSEVYYPLWKCFVDGKETKIYRANYLLRSIFLPKGEHEIIMKYHPKSFYISLYITIFIMAILVLGFIGYLIYIYKQKEVGNDK